MKARLLALLLAGLSAAACGTTVPQGELARAVFGDPSSLGGTTGAAPTLSGEAGVSAGTTSSGPRTGVPSVSGGMVGGGATGGTTGVGSRTSGGTGGLTAPGAANGPGVTATTISLGLLYSPDAGAARAAVGANVDFGDPKAAAEAVVNDINTHGGILGRKVKLEYFAIRAASSESTAQQYGAACQKFTRDTKVLAVFPVADGALSSCLAKGGVMSLSAGISENDASHYAAIPTHVDVSANTPESAMLNLVDSLANAAWLTTRWDTNTGGPGGALPVNVGVLYTDQPQWKRATEDVLLPELAKRGIRVDPANVFQSSYPKSSSETGAFVAQVQSAVVKFRQNNVTHVIPVDVNSLGFFTAGAESQRYRPRYAVTTASQPQLLVDAGVTPARQLNGALGFGWQPLIDVSDYAKYPAPGRAACLRMAAAAGQRPTGPTAEFSIVGACDAFYGLRQALGAFGKSEGITGRAIVHGFEALGTRFTFASIPAGSFSTRKHWATASGYPYAFDASCQCMAYTGRPYRLR